MDTFISDRSTPCKARHERRAARFWALARQGLLGFSLAMACQSALAQAVYRIKLLSHVSACPSTFVDLIDLNGHDETTAQKFRI